MRNRDSTLFTKNSMHPIIGKVQLNFKKPTKLKDVERFYDDTFFNSLNLPVFYTREYFSPFNLIFLSKLKNLELFTLETTFCIRDGLLPLLTFFLKYPVPLKSHKSTLLIPAPLSAYVPEKWRIFCASYEFAFNSPAPIVKAGGILLSGHLSANTFSLKAALEALKAVVVDEKMFILLDDASPSLVSSELGLKAASFQLKKNFFSSLPNKAIFIEDRQIYGLPLHTGWSYVDVDQSLYVYDKWSIHYFSALGLQIKENIDVPKGVRFPVNLFEDVIVSEMTAGTPNKFNDLYIEQKLLKVETSDYPRFIRSRVLREHEEKS